MQNNLDNKIISEYKSNSQKIRVMSETWTGENIFCPNCGCDISNYEIINLLLIFSVSSA
jgi:type II restriction enzyme